MKKISLALIFLWLTLVFVPSYGALAPKPVALAKAYEMALKNSKPLIQLEIDQGLAIKKRNELAERIELVLVPITPKVELEPFYRELSDQNAALEANERYYRSLKLSIWLEVKTIYMQLLRETLSEQLESERLLSQTLLLPKIYNEYLNGTQSKEAYKNAQEEIQGIKVRLDQSLAVQTDLWKKLSALTGQKMSKENTQVIQPTLYKFDAPSAPKLSASALKADYELYLASIALETTLEDLNALMNAYQVSFGADASFMATFERQSPVNYNVLFPLYKEFLNKVANLTQLEFPFVLPDAFKGSDFPLIDALVAREKAKDRVKIAQTQVSLHLDLAVNQYTTSFKNYDLSLKTLAEAEAEYKQLESALMTGKINGTQMAAATYKKRNLIYDKDLKYLDLYEASAELAKLLGQF